MQEKETLVEFVLRNADRIRKCVDDKRRDPWSARREQNSGYQKNRISNPTEAQALQRIEPIAFIHCPFGPAINGRRDARYIRLPEKWLQVEDSTRRFYTSSDNEKIVQLYTRRYLQGEYGELWSRTCKELGITQAWYYVVVHDIIRFAELYAAGIGLISPYSRFEDD